MPHSFFRCLQLVDFVGQLFKLPPVFNRRSAGFQPAQMPKDLRSRYSDTVSRHMNRT
jgi:hypothetical protein